MPNGINPQNFRDCSNHS